jgi:hypothetical protein
MAGRLPSKFNPERLAHNKLMMKHRAFLILFLLPLQIFSQVRGIVVDKETGIPIEYANIWIENQDTGTTSDIDGKFQFKENAIGKKLIVSAIGYEKSVSLIEKEDEIIKLNPTTYEIGEVVIRPRKSSNEFVIDKYDKSSIHNYFSCGIYPWIVAKYFNFFSLYEQTPYLKQLKILVDSRVKASFNLRLINANENGEPTSDILNKNLIIKTGSGKRNIKVDLSEYNIQFPKRGFFVALEWLTIESNKSEFNYSDPRTNKKISEIRYEPSFGTTNRNNGFFNWVYSNGNWRKTKIAPPQMVEKGGDLAIELTISD